MIFPGVPDFPVIVPGAFCVSVIQHGIQGHLESNVDGLPVPCHHAHRRAQSAARTFSTNYDLNPPNAEFPGVVL